MTRQAFDAINQRRIAEGKKPLTFTESPSTQTAASIVGAPSIKELRKLPPVGVLAGIREQEAKKKTARLDQPPKFNLRPSTDEEKLNKTEAAYLASLRVRADLVWIGVQNITVKLANDCRLTPDFATLDSTGKLTLIDVKGFQREDALIKMKVAARMFPMFSFLIVKREGGGWKNIEVKA